MDNPGEFYEPPEEQRFDGQQSFKSALETSFPRCWQLIQEHGFQTAWKKITGKPQDGNQNPNWKDQLDFLSHAIARGIDTTDVECPAMPMLRREKDRKSFFTKREWWWLNWQAADLYRRGVKDDRKYKRNGGFTRDYANITAAQPPADALPTISDEPCG